MLCYGHYVKIGLNLLNVYKYVAAIRDKYPQHPISSMNQFITFTFYYAILFTYIHLLK